MRTKSDVDAQTVPNGTQEWQTVGPAAQILIDVISHHVDRGHSPAEAAGTVGHALHARDHSEEAAKAHMEEHSKK
jgi:hypothetical protein